ncbi:NAD-dependent aldehyde dehydrogenase [Crepidotus variabilis]|uniref:NAD-dependent aldehyde dehydrogenase n=1 Tax=Crepidotus variabilis TaxID=179855 RepID=A0A9P6JT58_9AGAR|nr:NAD-dependent aldehyde dehydrogenase [Crepidotus variabilis]
MPCTSAFVHTGTPSPRFSYEWNTPMYTGKTTFNTGIFIDGKFRHGSDGKTIELVMSSSNGKFITSVAEATSKDVDDAVVAAQKAFDTVWGLNAPGSVRSEHLWNLAKKMEEHQEELAALEALDNGKTYSWALKADVAAAIQCIKYYAGWADKITGKTIETSEQKFAYTRHEPIGVVGQIIPWNFPILMWAWKIAPALATGNTVVLKPSEFTPLTAIRMCSLLQEAGIPDGVINLVTGYGHTVGAAMSSHMKIDKVAFTGSTLVGRTVMESAAKSNLKNVTLELGGKSANIIFDDADLDQAVNWAAHGIFWNHGQACCAGSRIFVQSGIYDEFLKRFSARAAAINVGDPFGKETDQGPQVSQNQYDRIMGYIKSGREEGAKVHFGGERHGKEGYFISPTIFTETKPEMKIVKEEIFGPVGVVIKFESEKDVIEQANNTEYGLAAAVFTQNLNRAIDTAHKLKAGTAWINCINQLHAQIPFGGFKQSGIGRELGEYALQNYTEVKAVHVNLGHKM